MPGDKVSLKLTIFASNAAIEGVISQLLLKKQTGRRAALPW